MPSFSCSLARAEVQDVAATSIATSTSTLSAASASSTTGITLLPVIGTDGMTANDATLTDGVTGKSGSKSSMDLHDCHDDSAMMMMLDDADSMVGSGDISLHDAEAIEEEEDDDEDETNYGLMGRPRPTIDLLRTQVSTARLGPLYSGACFEGEQRSGSHSYRVNVRLQYVDLSAAFLCGYLHIHGLTPEYPELITFFEADIIGRRHSFLTRKWGAGEEVDRKHWTRFPAFKQYERTFNRDTFQYDFADNDGGDAVFMRWKEHFLVPDHRVQSVNGASFAGFYYICCKLSTGTIAGYYYHTNSEWFQCLSLQHQRVASTGTYQLR